MTVLLAPTATAAARPLGGRTFRKQILKAGGLDYRQPDGKTRRLNFDGAYFADLSTAFQERAYDSVKAIMADGANRHTMDPERMRGDVVDLVPSEDGSGLDAIMTLSEDTARLVAEHPDLGVSARIVEGHERGDGKVWPRAIQHVLLTTDPRVTGLSPWRQVNLSAEDAHHDVVDLSSATTTQEGAELMADLSDADITRIVDGLHARMGQEGAGPAAGDDPDGAGGDLFADEVSDADVEAFLAAGDFDDDGDGDGEGEGSYAGADTFAGAGAGADLSNPYDERFVDLAERNAALSEQMATMNAELSGAKWERERDELLNMGVPPAMLDLAAPVLEAAHQGAVLDLSHSQTGETVSPPAVIRNLLRQAAGIVDLAGEQGHGAKATAAPDDTAAAHAVWESTYGGKS